MTRPDAGAQQLPDGANDNPESTEGAISLSDLAKLSGIDEDILLQRLARIMDKRAKNVRVATREPPR